MSVKLNTKFTFFIKQTPKVFFKYLLLNLGSMGFGCVLISILLLWGIKSTWAQLIIVPVAAIEAARAGNAGRGFSVVANEIRKLGDTVKQSTREINSVVRDTLHVSNQLIRFIQETAKLSEEQATEIQNLMTNIQTLQEVSNGLKEGSIL